MKKNLAPKFAPAPLALALVLTMALAAAMAQTACSGDDEAAAVTVSGVTLSSTALSLFLGGPPAALTAEIAPADATDRAVTWNSDAPEVAGVAAVDGDGLGGLGAAVTPLSVGSANITVTTRNGGRVATCAVSVKAGAAVSLPATFAVGEGNTAYLVATIEPADAANKNVSWQSSDPQAVRVSASPSGTGLAAAVTGVARGGSATITATMQEGGGTAACTVTVTEHVPPTIYVATGYGLHVNGSLVEATADYVVNDVFVDVFGKVHAAGSYWDSGLSKSLPLYYVDGTVSFLPTMVPDSYAAYAQGVYAAEDGRVHVVGFENGTYTQAARAWTDGGASPLNGIDVFADQFLSYANEVCVRGGDVYAVGCLQSQAGGVSNPVVWKNGSEHVFATASSVSIQPIWDFGFDSNGVMYVLVGGTNNSCYPYTIDPGLTALTPYALQSASPDIHHVCVDGTDFYVAGWSGNSGHYWKNGVRHDLEVPEGATSYRAYDVFVYNGHAYVGGFSRHPEGTLTQVWVDGQLVKDDRAIKGWYTDYYVNAAPNAIYVR